MKTGKKRLTSSLTGALILFATVAVFVSVAVCVFAAAENAAGGSKPILAGVMLAVILALSAICTFIDVIRRRYTLDAPVREILDATDRITKGDFSVRLRVRHSLNDYDELDRIMENLNIMVTELSKTEVLHSDFISNVSHEFKTPLSVIQSYATMLANKDLDAETRAKYAETIVAASARLTTLVSDILKLNKLDNGEISAARERIDLAESLAEATLGYEDIIEAKGLELICDFADGVSIESDPSYLEIVWNNLLSNAVKFTEHGSISVSLEKANGRAVIKVTDTGCGISADIGKHIFERFYQGDTSHAGEGNGLGLALVKRVIDIIGGTISVSSELGKGTTFTVSLEADN